MIYNLIRLH